MKEISSWRDEVLVPQGHDPEPPIPEPILEKWQKIVNLMAELLDVPAGLIMRILGEDIHVFVSSSTEGNPYHPGDSEHFWGSGLYCETDVILRLRNFFKASEGEKTSLKINEVVEGIVMLVRHELERNHVLLGAHLSERLPTVQGDSVQLQQVLLNLILNAADALADVVNRPRELTIVTRPESGGVRVEVKDNGVGIEKEKLESIFQPFYTTKTTGMGLGLSISRSIIKNHGGQLIAQPNNGPGTTFCFTLT